MLIATIYGIEQLLQLHQTQLKVIGLNSILYNHKFCPLREELLLLASSAVSYLVSLDGDLNPTHSLALINSSRHSAILKYCIYTWINSSRCGHSEAMSWQESFHTSKSTLPLWQHGLDTILVYGINILREK